MRVCASRIPRLFGASGLALYVVVLIVPERAGDQALIAHERLHCREQIVAQLVWWWVLSLVTIVAPPQTWPWLAAAAALPLWWAAYLLPAFRLAAEVRAYRVQIDLGGISPQRAAHHLATLYRLDITEATARRALGY